MEPRKLSNVEWQAIINITPDSFSDGGVNNSPVLIQANIKKLYQLGCRHFDFGAQSTAPTSKGITFLEELRRFEKNLFPLFRKDEVRSLFNHCRLSFDTFRGETIHQIVQMLNQEGVKPKELIWNDVSGVVSEDVVEFLTRENSSYVLCHNLAGSREETGHHMKYTSELMGEEFIWEMGEYFKERLQLVPSQHFKQIIIDPCFGFSKTSEQNIFLLKHLNILGASVGGDFRYLIGISRKKFLREISGINLENIDQLDHFQSEMLGRSLSGFPYFSYIRSHSNPL